MFRYNIQVRDLFHNKFNYLEHGKKRNLRIFDDLEFSCTWTVLIIWLSLDAKTIRNDNKDKPNEGSVRNQAQKKLENIAVDSGSAVISFDAKTCNKGVLCVPLGFGNYNHGNDVKVVLIRSRHLRPSNRFYLTHAIFNSKMAPF